MVMVTTILAAARYVEVVAGSLLSIDALYFIVGVTYGLSIFHAALLRFWKRTTAAILLQILGDLIVVTALVFVAGGAAGGFVLLYPITVLEATVLLQRRGGVMASILAAAFHGAILFLVSSGVLPAQGLSDVRFATTKTLVYAVFLNALVCVTVALTGAYFTQSLKRAGTRLEEVAAEVADLREVNEMIVESIQSGLLTTDRARVIQHVNCHGELILGLSREKLRGMTITELFGVGALDLDLLGEMADGAKVVRFEIIYNHPDKKKMILGLSVSRLASVVEAGPIGCLVVFKDLTEIKRIEEQMKSKERLAALGEMAAQLAHEIRNPLGSISGAAQVLMNDSRVSGEEEQLLAIIRRESQRLSDTLTEFLIQARPAAMEMGVVDLGTIIEQAATLLKNGLPEGARHSIVFKKDAGPHLCRVNPAKMTQVFWNLARNGMEAMPKGGLLKVDMERAAEEIVLRVRDEGKGITREEKKPEFATFTTGSESGTGLGLAIVYRIVRDHQGDIAIRGIPGQGTEVEVRLPAARGGEAENRRAPEQLRS